MKMVRNRNCFALTILAALSLLIFAGCGGDQTSNGGDGSYTATLSGGVDAQVRGSTEFRASVAPLSNFLLSIGAGSDYNQASDELTGLFMGLTYLEGIPPVGTYEIDTATIMDEEKFNLEHPTFDFWDQGTRYFLELAEEQEITITSSSSSLVEGNFTVDVTITPLDSDDPLAGTLQVQFSAPPQ